MGARTAGPSDTRITTDDFRLGGDLRIGRLGFGAMRLARNGWNGPARPPEVGRAVLRRALELGVNHIDTADFYRSGDGAVRANELIRQALHPYPSDLVIATKVGPIRGATSLRQAAASELRALVENNLSSLGVERLDLLYLRIGRMTPPHGESIAERFEVLTTLRKEGLVRHLGLSNVDADQLAEAQAIAPVAAVQNSFSIASRDDGALLDACTKGGIAFVPFGPLGGGQADVTSAHLTRVAARHGATVSQVALAWLLARSPVMLAIPGTGSIAHLEENAGSRSLALTAADLDELAGLASAGQVKGP